VRRGRGRDVAPNAFSKGIAMSITSQLESQGLEAAETEFEDRTAEAFAPPDLMEQFTTLVSRHPNYSVLGALGLGLGLGLLIRGMAGWRNS
jgi:hypothetical protein